MKSYDCDYTWTDVKDAVNKCLSVILKTKIDDALSLYDYNLPKAMDDIASYVFTYGTASFMGLAKELNLVREGLVQLHAVGYIGKQKD